MALPENWRGLLQGVDWVMVDKLRLLVFGIDGASLDVVQRLLGEGRLPSLAALGHRGVGGWLGSTFPPHTAPGWASMFTGVEPGRHGIFQFWSTQAGDYDAHAVHAGQMAREPLWAMLERHGWRVGVYNMPMTHPPRALKGGYMISWPLSNTLRYTEPPTLASELADAGLHYHSDLVSMYRGQVDYPQRAADYIRGRAETALHLQRTRPVDAMFVCFTEVDRISHHYWESADEPGEDVLRAYEQVDEALGRLLELTDEETLVLVSSDHGFGACTADINLLPLLRDAGLLATRFERDRTPVGASAPRDDLATAQWFQSPHVHREVIDWARTEVYMPTPGCFGLNLNLKGREANGIVATAARRRHIERRLREVLASLRAPALGGCGFDVVRREEVYRGDRVDEAPDYLLVPDDWSLMPVFSFEPEVVLPPQQVGVHRPDGILFAAGPGLVPGAPVAARIEDVTPFILAQLGLAVPEDIDGHWLMPPAMPLRREAAHAVDESRALTDEEAALMDRRLAEIGYLA